MPRKKFRLSLKVDTILYILFFATIALAISIPSLGNKGNQAKTSIIEGDFPTVKSYDLFFNIDLSQKLFQSRQLISLVNSNASRREITFLIHPDLVIDRIGFTSGLGQPLGVSGWRFDQPVSYMRVYGMVTLNKATVTFKNEIEPQQTLLMELEYHLNAEAFQGGMGRNFYGLFVSSQNQRAIGFDSGAFPVIESNGAAPLKITVKYPETEVCGVPGQLVSTETSQGFITSTYQTVSAYDPAFSCGAYTIEQNNGDGIGVEFYLTRGQTYQAAMGEAALDYFNQYRQLFGDAGQNTFRFVFVPTEIEGGGAESKGNTVYLGTQNNLDAFANYQNDINVQMKFKALVGHEEFHEWNAYHASWTGELKDWWTEGGANFMSAWAGEMLWGKTYGRSLRAQYSVSYNAQMPYLFPGTLKSPGSILQGDTWKGESTLTYDYGALVWEQLRQKIGGEALQAGLSEFIQQSSRQPGTYTDFIKYLQRHTGEDVSSFLEPWISHNPRIDLSIQRVATQPDGSQYTTVAIISVLEDKPVEFFTSLGYKTQASLDWETVPLHVRDTGNYQVKFTSQERPTIFQLDPEFQVPQTNYNNDIWPPVGTGN